MKITKHELAEVLEKYHRGEPGEPGGTGADLRRALCEALLALVERETGVGM